jgi:hypothetical protein
MPVDVGTDSYVTLAEANTYLGGRLYTSAWDSAVDADREKALKMATRAIDRQALTGVPKSVAQRLDQAQALAFPRCYPTGPSKYACETEVPQAVKDAQVEEALALLDRGNSKRRQLQQEGVLGFGIGKVRETFAAGQTGKTVRPPPLISPEARELLAPYLLRSVSIA